MPERYHSLFPDFEQSLLKKCGACKFIKPTSDFYTLRTSEKTGKIWWDSICKECRKVRSGEYQKKNLKKIADRNRLPKNREKSRKRFLLKKYGVGDFQAMMDRQGGNCAICRMPFDGARRPNVDHDHKSGKTRGLLCVHCNFGLGSFMDNQDVLHAAIAYLAFHGGQNGQVQANY